MEKSKTIHFPHLRSHLADLTRANNPTPRYVGRRSHVFTGENILHVVGVFFDKLRGCGGPGYLMCAKKPERAIGPLASLFNVSYVAARHSDSLTLLPPLCLQSAVSDLNLYLSGKHFLLTDTAAAFDLTSPIPARRLGFAVGRNDDFRLC